MRWNQRIFLDPDAPIGYNSLLDRDRLIILRPRNLLEMKVSRMAMDIPFFSEERLKHQGLTAQEIREHSVGWLDNVLYPLLSSEEIEWSKGQPGSGGQTFPRQLATRRALRDLPSFLEPFLGV